MRAAAEIVRAAEIVVEIAVAAGVLAAEDVVAVAVDVLEAAVEIVVAADVPEAGAAAAAGGTRTSWPRIFADHTDKPKGRRKLRPFLFVRSDVI